MLPWTSRINSTAVRDADSDGHLILILKNRATVGGSPSRMGTYKLYILRVLFQHCDYFIANKRKISLCYGCLTRKVLTPSPIS